MTPEELLACATEFVFKPTDAVEGDYNVSYWSITVSRRGENSYAVIWNGEIWNGEGWEYEPLPSSRTDEFLQRCRFPLTEAVSIAREKADTVITQGQTYTQWREGFKATSE